MKNKKALVALVALLLVGIVGGTYAYFQSTVNIPNTFKIADGFEALIDETFDQETANSWLPGVTVNKEVWVENTGELDMVVRVYVDEQWPTDCTGCTGTVSYDDNGTTKTEDVIKPNILDVGTKWLLNEENGVKYYYYYKVLAPGEKTDLFLDSITLSDKLTNGNAHLGKTYIYDIYADTIQPEGAVDLWPVTVTGTTVALNN